MNFRYRPHPLPRRLQLQPRADGATDGARDGQAQHGAGMSQGVLYSSAPEMKPRSHFTHSLVV